MFGAHGLQKSLSIKPSRLSGIELLDECGFAVAELVVHQTGGLWTLKALHYLRSQAELMIKKKWGESMKIKVEKPTQQYLDERKVKSWPTWEKEVSRFDWHYDETEECYLLEGKVVIETKDGKVEFGVGDFVTFPAGLSCVWDIKKPVRKHYNFR